MRTPKEIESVKTRLQHLLSDDKTLFVIVTARPDEELELADYSIFRNACVHEALAMVDAAKGFLCEEAHNESKRD